MYLAGTINALLDASFPASQWLGRQVPYKALSRHLNATLKPLKIKVRVVKSDAVTPYEKKRELFDVAGEYVEVGRKKSIIVTVHVSERREYLTLTKSALNRLVFFISATAQHELIHADQFLQYPHKTRRALSVAHSSRMGKARKQQIEYLRHWHEIDAFAHDVAMEMKFFYPDIDTAEIVRYIEQYPKLISFRLYTTVFKGTEWSSIRKTLLRRILKWIPSAKIPHKI